MGRIVDHDASVIDLPAEEKTTDGEVAKGIEVFHLQAEVFYEQLNSGQGGWNPQRDHFCDRFPELVGAPVVVVVPRVDESVENGFYLESQYVVRQETGLVIIVVAFLEGFDCLSYSRCREGDGRVGVCLEVVQFQAYRDCRLPMLVVGLALELKDVVHEPSHARAAFFISCHLGGGGLKTAISAQREQGIGSGKSS